MEEFYSDLEIFSFFITSHPKKFAITDIIMSIHNEREFSFEYII